MSEDLSIACKNGCGRAQSRSRGLCSMCYQNLLKEVKAGRTTWQELAAAVRCLPAKAVSKHWGWLGR